MKKLLTFILVLVVQESIACGNVYHYFQTYEVSLSKESKSSFLLNSKENSMVNYVPLRDDELIVTVLLDAINSGEEINDVKSVLSYFNCAYSSHKSDNYQALISKIGNDNYLQVCPKELTSKLYYVAADGGVNLREKPNKDSSKLDAIVEGSSIKLIKIDGQWAQVQTYAGLGYVYLPLIKKL